MVTKIRFIDRQLHDEEGQSTSGYDGSTKGVHINDPFCWLEEEGENTRLFEQEQHRRTLDAMRSDPYWRFLLKHLNQLSRYDEWHSPKIRQGSLAYLRRPPETEQYILQFIPAGSLDIVTVYDPSNASPPRAIDWFFLSEDGRYVFFGISQQGDEWSTLYIYDSDTQKILDDTIPGARWSSVYMPPHACFFYYTKYPLQSSGERKFYSQRVFRHELGTATETDIEIFSDSDPTATFSLSGCKDGRRLVISTHRGWSRNQLSLLDFTVEGTTAQMVFDGESQHMEPFWDNQELYGLYHDATTGDEIKKWNGSRDWSTVFSTLPTQPIKEAVAIDSGFVMVQMKDARYCLEYLSHKGDLQEIDLPHGGIGTVQGLSADYRGNTVFFEWTSFDQPLRVYAWHIPANGLEEWGTHNALLAGIRIWQEFVPVDDKTVIPIFLAQDTQMSVSPRPAIVGGYGGFNIAYSPVYSPGIHLWLKSGGLYVVAGLPGGSEFGEQWHQRGMREQKQNVFDAMTLVLRYLSARNYSKPSMLGITGRSNGGLLTGAVMTQHPELIASAVIGVPLLDMLRYDRFLVAALWRSEYGDPANPVDWQWLQRCSPYHHIVPHTKYPAAFIFTSSHDNRVHPLHARKMAARLQKESGSKHPTFLRIEPQAGHGIGKSRRQQIEEEADIWTFQFRQLGLAPKSD